MNTKKIPSVEQWLAVSTSGPLWTVYLGPRQGEGQQVELQAPRGHARDLLGSIEDLLATAGLQLSDLAGLAVDVGPGSFTSLRMGLATVRALAWACDRPVATSTSLAALAAQADARDQQVFSLVPARRGWWYVGQGHGARVAEVAVVADAELAAWVAERKSNQAVAVGAWSAALLESLSLTAAATAAQPTAAWVAKSAGEPGPALGVMPAYLAASEAEIAKGWFAPDLAIEASDRRI